MNTPLTQRNSSHHVHAKTVGRVRVRSLAARGLAVVLIALAASLALPGDTIVLLMGDPIQDRPPTNLVRIHRVRPQ